MAQGLTAARELRVLRSTGRHEITVHPFQPQMKAQNLVCVNKVMCGAAGATNPGRRPDAAGNNAGSETRSAVSNNGHYAPREQWHLLTLATEEMDKTLSQPRNRWRCSPVARCVQVAAGKDRCDVVFMPTSRWKRNCG